MKQVGRGRNKKKAREAWRDTRTIFKEPFQKFNNPKSTVAAVLKQLLWRRCRDTVLKGTSCSQHKMSCRGKMTASRAKTNKDSKFGSFDTKTVVRCFAGTRWLNLVARGELNLIASGSHAATISTLATMAVVSFGRKFYCVRSDNAQVITSTTNTVKWTLGKFKT